MSRNERRSLTGVRDGELESVDGSAFWQQIGATVEVYSSRTAGGWIKGIVVDPQKAGLVTVKFCIDGVEYRKSFNPQSEKLRPVASLLDERQRGTVSSRNRSSLPQQMIFLSSVPLFQNLPKSELSTLAASCCEVEFREGQVLIKQGQEGTGLFVLMSGAVEIKIDGYVCNVLRSGAFFGENSLIHAVPCNATVTALSAATTCFIERDQFEELGLRDKLNFSQRCAVFGGHACQQSCKAPIAKNSKERLFLLKAIEANRNLQACIGSDIATLDMMVDAAWKQTVSAGQQVITEGDLEADFFYVVQEGSFTASKTKHHNMKDATKIVKGGSFGELALLYFQPRAATVVAETDAVVWVIDRKQFRKILSQKRDDHAKQYACLLTDKIFASCNEAEQISIARSLVEETFHEGDTIIKEGEMGDLFYVLLEGRVSITQKGVHVKDLEKGAIFGERALLTNEPRGATITVVSPTVKVLWMDKDSFQSCLPHFAIASAIERGKSAPHPRASQHVRIRQEDLTSKGLLGCGGFGAVELVEHKVTNASYALKSLSKGFIVKSGMQSSVMAEKSIQLLMDSPFVVKLYETYNGDQFLYFLMELASGGELHDTYCKKGLYGNEALARYYAASAMCAFEHVHSKKVIHRDLKPENLLLSGTGHCKLADFGLAKLTMGKTFTLCGTPEYFAPELLEHKGYTKAVDWYAVGILAFELMLGYTPFRAESSPETYRKIKKGLSFPGPFPEKLQGRDLHTYDAFVDFVFVMCDVDEQARPPAQRGGIENVKGHAWYKDFDWDGLQNSSLSPPYKPKAKSPSQMVRKNLHLPPQVTYKEDNSCWEDCFASSNGSQHHCDWICQ